MPFKNIPFRKNCILHLSIWSSGPYLHLSPSYLYAPPCWLSRQSRYASYRTIKATYPSPILFWLASKYKRVKASRWLFKQSHVLSSLQRINTPMFSVCGYPVNYKGCSKDRNRKCCFQGHSMFHDKLSGIILGPLKCWLGVSHFKIPVPS